MSRVCPDCGEVFESSADLCPYDGAELEDESVEAEYVGEIIDDRFRIDGLLGIGGMGRVYEATQLSVDRRVAVKLIRTENLQGEEIERRFYREAQVISDFSHPNIVRLIDFGEDDDLEMPYLVMEYIDGLVLKDLVRHQRLHPNLVLEVTAQVAAGLVEAHGEQIVHRDLKTENVLLVPVSPGGFQAKIIDFGIAFPRQTQESLTTTGAICGTPQYLSPQQARGEEVGPASDLYSLGVIVFEMTTGLLPFDADSTFDIMVKHVQERPPAISQFIQSRTIPDELEGLVANLLAKRPEDRPESARRVRDQVERIRAEADWEPLRLDDDREGLEAQLEPWLLPPAERGERMVAEGYAQQREEGSAPSRPATGARGRAGESGSQRPGTGEYAPSADTEPEPSRVPASKSPHGAAGSASPTQVSKVAPTSESRQAPGSSRESARPSAPSKSGVSNSSAQHGTGVQTGTSGEDEGRRSWLLLGTTGVLMAALVALVAAVVLLQDGSSPEEETAAQAPGEDRDAGGSRTLAAGGTDAASTNVASGTTVARTTGDAGSRERIAEQSGSDGGRIERVGTGNVEADGSSAGAAARAGRAGSETAAAAGGSESDRGGSGGGRPAEKRGESAERAEDQEAPDPGASDEEPGEGSPSDDEGSADESAPSDKDAPSDDVSKEYKEAKEFLEGGEMN